MEILNYDSPDYKQANNSSKLEFSFFNHKRFNISAGAVRKWGFKPKQYLHFIVDDDKLLFIVNDNPLGMRLYAKTGGTNLWGYIALMRRILQQRQPKVDFNNIYAIKKMHTKVNECNTFQILTYKKLKNDKPYRDKRKDGVR